MCSLVKFLRLEQSEFGSLKRLICESTEIYMQLVTEGTKSVIAEEKRESFINSRVHYREKMPFSSLKKHIVNPD